MIIIAERINATRRRIAEAMAERDAARLAREVRSQTAAGADFIDVNAGSDPAREIENLKWAVEVVQQHTKLPLCIDSAGAEGFRAGLEAVKGDTVMLNSVNGEPDRMLGFPVRLSEYAPNTFTTGLYVAILGDFFQGYWIVDSLDLQIARAEELLIRSNQDLFVMRADSDGAPVKEEAFVRVKLG